METTVNVDKALPTLKLAFGNPQKILAKQIGHLKNFEPLQCEQKKGKKLNNCQEEWFLKVEGVLHDIVKLEKQDKETLSYCYSQWRWLLSYGKVCRVRE